MYVKERSHDGEEAVTRESYIRVTGLIREHPGRIRFVQAANRILTALVFLSYPLLLLGLLAEKNQFFVRALLVPAISFLLLSAVRGAIRAPRPYEKFGIPPVLKKETRGKSFPSRHVFSAFMIAMTVYARVPWAGAVIGVFGLLIGCLRVAGGVHEPRDVIAGALFGIACGLLFYPIF